MQFIFDFSYLVALGLCATLTGCGALLLCSRVAPLVARQRVALHGVSRHGR